MSNKREFNFVVVAEILDGVVTWSIDSNRLDCYFGTDAIVYEGDDIRELDYSEEQLYLDLENQLADQLISNSYKEVSK